MKRSFAAVALALGLAGILPPLPARADDSGAWLWIEGRVPVVRKPLAEAGRIDFRVFGDFETSMRARGANFVQARMGPLFFLTDWLFIAPQASVAATRTAEGSWQQQAWLELEPNFFGAIGDFVILDRHRGEYRYRDGARDSWMYRNMLRVAYAPEGASVIPFVSDEIWINATLGQLVENRASIGVGFLASASTRFDIAYMFRSSKTSDWGNQHVLSLFVFLDAPAPPPPRTTPTLPPPPTTPLPAAAPTTTTTTTPAPPPAPATKPPATKPTTTPEDGG